MNCTISLQDVSLALVHIPRTRVSQLSRSILTQILAPNAFLNITCNEEELSIFADYRMLEDFEDVARRDRQRQRSSSGSTSIRSRKLSRAETTQPIEISYDRWSVLQIDSHDDQQDSSGARVHELSAPLAAAGISILYQSSYQSDFIFVRQARLAEVIGHLSFAGFDIFSGESQVISRPISPATSPVEMHHKITQDLTSRSLSTDSTSTPTRAKSHSPTTGEVRILSSDLTCVGLSDDSADVDNWVLKIVKLVAFPELIALPARTRQPTPAPPPKKQTATDLLYTDFARGRSTTTPFYESYDGDGLSSDSSADEEAYFSHSPSVSSPSLSAVSRSQSDVDFSPTTPFPAPYRKSSKHVLGPLSPIIVNAAPRSPVVSTSPTSADSFTIPSRSSSTDKIAPPKRGPPTIPFFSFTRTSEGSSLTADVSILATLFPKNERHMVICGGQLDAVDQQLARRLKIFPFSADAERENSDDDSDEEADSLMQCLQIDLKRFGLEKHGLVNRFSRILEENHINHMYSSTFKTANILVEKRHALRAQALLRSC